FTVEISMDVAGVIVYVTDQGGPGHPRLRDITDLAEGGRGLLTVEALTATWSWTGDSQGRTVRATFPRTALCAGGPEIGRSPWRGRRPVGRASCRASVECRLWAW